MIVMTLYLEVQYSGKLFDNWRYFLYHLSAFLKLGRHSITLGNVRTNLKCDNQSLNPPTILIH